MHNLLHKSTMQSLIYFLALCYFFFVSPVAAKSSRPHIIVIVADDLGWNDVSFHGSPQIPTPHLDFLAKNGIVLNNYYVCAICSPSRGSLMTGLYPIHTGLQTDVIYADQPYGLPLNLRTLPNHLQNLNYSTHAVGKWHLGFFRKEYTPTYRGFESHFGYWCGKEDYYDHTQNVNQMWGLDFHYNLTTVRDGFGKYSTTLFTDHAVKIINEHDKEKPLFLYLAYQAVHSANTYSPLQAPPEYVARFPNIKGKNRKIFAGMVSAMDDGVGSVMRALEEQGMIDNSIIIFTTDNGGPAAGFNDNAASNWPLRGVKYTLWEGGVRGAAFLWSRHLPKTSVAFPDLMHMVDWMPTLYRAAGGDVSSLGKIDGLNMWDTFLGKQSPPREEILLNIDPIAKNSALRLGRYKIITGQQYDGHWDGWYGPSGRENGSINSKFPYEVVCKERPVKVDCKPQIKPCLFDIETDPCEYHNLADSQPQIVEKLLRRLAFYNSTMVPPGNKPADPTANPKFHNYEWVNWMDDPTDT